MKALWLAMTIVLSALLSACGANVLSTGSVGPDAQAAVPPPPVTPTARAFAVGTASARATRCGFHFDPAKLRANFLAAEQQTGASPEDLAKIEKSYDVSAATMAKVIANEENYCADEKTKLIKADLTRHLAGDYTPGAPHAKKEEDEGLFSSSGGLFSGSSSSSPPSGGREVFE